MDRLGDYRLRKRLAVGGMGEVYLGEKVGPEGFLKPVVLKCVLPQLAKDRAFVQLFLDEARLAALLNHPNIAQVYDFGTVDNVYYMAMEYVPGYTVDEIRRKHRSIDVFMPMEHIACISTQACQGLHYAHTLTDAHDVGLGLVHRDVSPHNLIVSVDGAVKIVDFGIAKARAGLTRVQAKGAVGKFGYMSPEQSRGEPVDARTDVFSLGICLWELTTNRRLHDPKLDRPPEYHKERPIPPVTAFRRDVPRQFEKILESALAIDPNERYASCQDMHIELERFLTAMSHYAGVSALAGYIKGLVEGKFEKQEAPAGAGAVEPGGPTVSHSGKKQAPPSPELEAARRYEEVFGVGLPEKDNKPSFPKAVPASWEIRKAPASVPPEAPASPANESIALAVPSAGEKKKQDEKQRREQERKARVASAVDRARTRTIITVAAIAVVVAGVGAAGWFYKDAIIEQVQALRRPEVEPPKRPVSTTYRITTDPPGATVLVDGKVQPGVTPLILELIPGAEYWIEVQMPKYGTKRAQLKASSGFGTREVPFLLSKAGTLKVSSTPPGARIEVNGFEIRNTVTPATLEDVPGGEKLRVTVTLTGRAPVTKSITVPEGKTKTLDIEIDK